MHPSDPDMLHRRAMRTRRLVGLGGIVFSVGMILSIAIYYTYILHPGSISRIIHNPLLPASTPTPTVTCKTPAHATGDSTVTITSGGIQRSMIVHLAPSYGVQ